jgi:Transposase IS116/IS110/IS902 family
VPGAALVELGALADVGPVPDAVASALDGSPERIDHRAHIIDTGTESWRFRHGLGRRRQTWPRPGRRARGYRPSASPLGPQVRDDSRVIFPPTWPVRQDPRDINQRARLARQLRRLPASPQQRVAKALLRRIDDISREQSDLFDELTTLIQAHTPQLLEQPGVGTVTAAVIIGRTAGAQRFRSEACFARHAGTAPIPASSGKSIRHRLHRAATAN